MARSSPSQALVRPSATSLRHFPAHPKPSPPSLSAVALRRAAAALLLAAAVALPCAVLYRAAVLGAARPVQMMGLDRRPWWERDQPPPPAVVVPEEDGDVDPAAADDLDSDDIKLEQVLQEASMDNNTVILTTLNAAWASSGSVIELFIDSFRRGVRTSPLLRHLVIITFDWKAYKRCMEIHTYCFALVTEDMDFSQEKRFQTAGYLDMMWKRLDFLRLVLEKGYSFVFSDADIMWFRNPFPHFYPDGDFQIACDHYVGNATDLGNIANGGFNYVRSNNQSIEFYKFWYSSRLRYPGHHDQDVFNAIKHDPYITDIGLKIKFLSTTYFGGICEPSRDLNKVCTMHANCCIGLQSKLHDLRIIMEDWGNYMSMPPSLKRFGALAWREKRDYRIINFAKFDAFSNIS
uniref:Nucleotide-diphospho-sugar transferase domain-containing protein n=1 Tax=Leersia perrieri TaxID=77586 RepID=A0A0D9VJL8_9ORYZ